MAEWIYFLHPPRDNFAATMTEAEQQAWGEHFQRLRRCWPSSACWCWPARTLGTVNTGVAVFETPDEQAAQAIVDADPAIAVALPVASCGRSGCRCCGAASVSSTSAPAGHLDYFQSWLGYRQWLLRIPGVQVAVLDHGQRRVSAAFGHADLSTGQPLTVGHLFRVASHSKTFTAVAVLQLVEAGRLRLDDTVANRLPELAGSPLAGVQVRELLSHGGGVIRDSQDGDFWQLHRNFPDRQQLLAIAAEPAAAVLARNDRFKYSNIGYGLLGLIIEAVTGASYQDWVGAAIIARLGLADTGPELVESRRAELAAGHSALAYADERSVSSTYTPARWPRPPASTPPRRTWPSSTPRCCRAMTGCSARTRCASCGTGCGRCVQAAPTMASACS